MNWYLSKIVFRIVCGDGQHKPQFDEQLRLIEAANEWDAFERAKSIGNMEQDAFYNEKQKLVQWKFINVSELYRLSEHLDGAELYSRVQETEDADTYIELTNQKAAHLKQNSIQKYLHIL